MVTYILEIICFQLVFLLIYDLFLKRETFFQWNRVYLLFSFAIAILLPWIKIEALKTTLSQDVIYYPEFLWQLQEVTLSQNSALNFWEQFSWYQWLFFVGALIMLVWFALKLHRIYQLRQKGVKTFYLDYTKIVVPNSTTAFSFFKQVFLGDGISKEKEPQILAHELVHIRQWHSLDLIFFELMRIVFWFNPLTYLYQFKLAELHEYIADSHVAKYNKKAHYQSLLAEAFQTQNLSFVNQFFKQSLIKKRIVMLTKKKSKAVYQLKYLLLLPLMLGILMYTSCEMETKVASQLSSDVTIDGQFITFKVYNLDKLTKDELRVQSTIFNLIEDESMTGELKVMDTFGKSKELNFTDGVIDNIQVSKKEGKELVPFAVIDQVPIFPGCENSTDSRACFQEKIQEHIRKNFNYPDSAQAQNIQGRVSLMFTISDKGEITDIQMRGPHKLLEDEAERIIKLLPQMRPGKKNGVAVNVPFSIPITFRLEDDIDVEIQKFASRNADWVPFANIDKAPVFPNCENASDSKSCFQEQMIKHIKKHFNYPKEAIEKGIQGRVAILFTIDKEGNIKGIQKRGPSYLLENEAERIIQRLPKLEPAIKANEPVDVVYSIPITFKL